MTYNDRLGVLGVTLVTSGMVAGLTVASIGVFGGLSPWAMTVPVAIEAAGIAIICAWSARRDQP